MLRRECRRTLAPSCRTQTKDFVIQRDEIAAGYFRTFQILTLLCCAADSLVNAFEFAEQGKVIVDGRAKLSGLRLHCNCTDCSRSRLHVLAFALAPPIVCSIKSIQEQGFMRVSMITGGGSGIGAAVARRLSTPDDCLILHGQGADAAGLERLKAVALDCQQAGAKVAWRTGELAN